jgi:MFS family permease
MLKNRVFSAGLAVATGMTFGMYAMLFLTPLYLQSARAVSALVAGLELLPMSVTFVIISQLSGKITNQFGPRVPMTAGMAMMGIGLFMLALIPVNDSLVVIEAALLVIGCGLGLNTGPVNGAVFAIFASSNGDSGHIVAGLAPAYIGGGIGEMIGAVTAFMFIRDGSLHQQRSAHLSCGASALPNKV